MPGARAAGRVLLCLLVSAAAAEIPGSTAGAEQVQVGTSTRSSPVLVGAYSFESFQSDFSRRYSPEEASWRREIFDANLALVQAQNVDPRASWRAGVNHFVDRTPAEIARFKGLDGHLASTVRGTLADGRSSLPLTPGGPWLGAPAAVDWREKGIVTPVKNQGGCGSCWAFAATEVLESALARATGELVVLSPQSLVSCSPNPGKCGGTGGCEGSIAEAAFNFTRDHGIPLERDYPYAGMDAPCTPGVEAAMTVDGYVFVSPNDHDSFIGAVATQGPLAVAVDADWLFYDSGVFEQKEGATWTHLDHAVSLVGYGTDPDSGKDYWLVRNSWGASWGEEGYIRLRRYGEGKEPCGIDLYPDDGFCGQGPECQCAKPLRVCGTSGILTQASIPVGATRYHSRLQSGAGLGVAGGSSREPLDYRTYVV